MNALFLHPPRNLRTAAFLTIPVGAFGVVNALRGAGYPVTGYNVPLEMKARTGFSIAEAMRRHRPSAVLVDLHWYEHACGALETAAEVKRNDPTCLVVLGGLTATIFAKDIVRDHPAVDVVVRGEAETSTRLLFDACFRGRAPLEHVPGLTLRRGGGILETPLAPPKSEGDSFDYADHSWLHNAELYLHATPAGINSPYRNFWLLVATGCLFDCSYCGGSRDALKRSFGRDRLWRRTPDEVAADIERLVAAGVDIVNPSHDISMLGPAFWRPLFARLSRLARAPGLYLEVFQLPSPAFLEAMAAVVSRPLTTLVFSPLVGDEKLRRQNGKLYGNAQLVERLATCRALGLRAQLGFSENLPGTDETTAAMQASLLEAIERVYPGIESYSQEITLDPHSAMAVDPAGHGIVRHFQRLADYVDYTRGDERSPRRNGYSLGVPAAAEGDRARPRRLPVVSA